jgi:hypothetical protein
MEEQEKVADKNDSTLDETGPTHSKVICYTK